MTVLLEDMLEDMLPEMHCDRCGGESYDMKPIGELKVCLECWDQKKECA